nr:MAG TPA: tail assembly chaperone protein [Bacteriophage sp.]
MSLRDQLLANKPEVSPIELMGETYYVKRLSVGEMNRHLFEQQLDLIKFAEKIGAKLPPEDDEEFEKALDKLSKRYHLPRIIASRLCDENGVLLFDADSLDDLNAIAELDSQLFNDFNNWITNSSPKPLASGENSK